MDKPQIIGLGLSGLIGSRITKLLEEDFEFIKLDKKSGIDITDSRSLVKIKEYTHADYVLHLAAKTDVDGCEEEKDLGEKSEAWRVNVVGTKNVAQICRETGKKIIYFSTDFVFDGKIDKNESYLEEDLPNPVNWYAVTKYEGEKAVEKSGADYLILRTAYPYRSKFGEKKDFFRSIKDKLEQNQQIEAVEDHYFCPTFVDNISESLKILIEKDSFGIYHLVGDLVISPYEAAILIAKVFDLDKNLINKTTREKFFKDKAPRPFNLNLKNDKIEKLGIELKGFEEGLLIIKSQIT